MHDLSLGLPPAAARVRLGREAEAGARPGRRPRAEDAGDGVAAAHEAAAAAAAGGGAAEAAAGGGQQTAAYTAAGAAGVAPRHL